MRRRRNHDNYPVGDESATKSASCRKIPQVCQFYSMFPICQTAKLKSLFTCLYCITFFDSKQYFFVNLFLERLNPQTYKIRHFCLCGASKGGFIVNIRKNALKNTEMSGFRVKKRHFPYIKQNSIAEIVSTMESFLVAGRKFLCCEATLHRATPCFIFHEPKARFICIEPPCLAKFSAKNLASVT